MNIPPWADQNNIISKTKSIPPWAEDGPAMHGHDSKCAEENKGGFHDLKKNTSMIET